MTSREPAGIKIGPIPILALATAALYFAREILIPLAFALTLTLILSPALSWLAKFHVRRMPGVLIVMMLVVSLAAGLTWIVSQQLIEIAGELPQYQDNIHRKLEALPTRGALGRAATSIQQLSSELSAAGATSDAGAGAATKEVGRADAQATPFPVAVVDQPRDAFQYARDFLRPFFEPLALIGIVLIFTIFMLAKKEDLRNRLLRLAGMSQLNVMTQALDDATRRVSRYLMLQLLVNATLGFLFGAGLNLIGVPYPFLWGTVAALLRLVPVLGILTALTLPVVLSLAVSDSWRTPLLVLALGVTLELITSNLIEPWLYGAHTGISSLAILVAAVFWTVLWGYSGLILSTPLTVCLLVAGRYVPQLSFLHVLLGDEPVLEPQAQIYQRLLAMDPTETKSIVDSYLKDHSLLELYDSVLIPALSLAEQDRHRGEIDAAREEFLFLSLNEMIAELSRYRPQAAEPDSDGSAEGIGASDVPAERRILCVPAQDQADEIASVMLAQLVEQQGDVVLSFPLCSDYGEAIAVAKPGPHDIICISSLPPYAFTPARRICKQLRSRFPKIAITVGVWGHVDKDKAAASFERAQPDQLFTSLLQAIEYIRPPRVETDAPALVETAT